jgi:hypothetical protein
LDRDLITQILHITKNAKRKIQQKTTTHQEVFSGYLNNIQRFSGWDIRTKHIKAGRNIETKLVFGVLLTDIQVGLNSL